MKPIIAQIADSGDQPSANASEDLRSEEPLKESVLGNALWLLFILVLASLPRLLLLVKSNFGIDSDEAIVGLMAKHILAGEGFPIFYYGQPYMGSFEPLLVAGLSLVIGLGNVALKLVPFFFSILHIVAVYFLAKRFTDTWGARLVALFAAIPPSALVLWSTKARGGFIELVVIGTLALLLSTDLFEIRKSSAKKFLALGLLLGFGWWVNNQIVFYLAAIGLVLSIRMLFTLGFKGALLAGLVILCGFFIGGAPFWFYNFTSSPKFESLLFLFGGGGVSMADTRSNLLAFSSTALPIILGARRFWSTDDVFLGASILAYLVFVIAIVGFVFSKSPKEKGRGALVLAFLLIVPLVFAASRFGFLSKAPRYLLPYYSVLFLLYGVAGRQLWKLKPLVGGLFISAVLLLHLGSNFAGGFTLPGEPFVFEGDRVSRDHRPLYSWLKERGYDSIRTNYWIGYRTAFETNEEITFIRFGHPRSLRIPSYEANYSLDNLAGVYVLTKNELPAVTRQLGLFGYDFVVNEVGEYFVVDQVHKVRELGREIELRPEMVSASHLPDETDKMLDDNLDTRWRTASAQSSDMAIEIQFPKIETVSAIRMSFGSFRHDAPRDLLIEAQMPDESWWTVADFHGTKLQADLVDDEFGDVPHSWEVYFEPRPVRALRLRQRGRAAVFDWSIAELDVYRPLVPSEGNNGEK